MGVVPLSRKFERGVRVRKNLLCSWEKVDGSVGVTRRRRFLEPRWAGR